MITHICPLCDSVVWNVQVKFDDYKIAFWYTDMQCAGCGAKALAPTPVDRPEGLREDD